MRSVGRCPVITHHLSDFDEFSTMRLAGGRRYLFVVWGLQDLLTGRR
jgi:hypothetical protein